MVVHNNFTGPIPKPIGIPSADKCLLAHQTIALIFYLGIVIVLIFFMVEIFFAKRFNINKLKIHFTRKTLGLIL